MCRSWAYHENRSTSQPTRSFFQALRDLFRRTPRRRGVAEVVPLPSGVSARRSERQEGTDRPKAA